MRHYRLGNDLVLRVALFDVSAEGLRQPHSLTGEVSMMATTRLDSVRLTVSSVADNIIAATFTGAEMRAEGVYTLTVVEKLGEHSRTIDICHAFELVGCACEASGETISSDTTLDIESVVAMLPYTIDAVLDAHSRNAIQNAAVAQAIDALAKEIPDVSDFVTKDGLAQSLNGKVDQEDGARLITEEEVEKFNNKAEKEGVYPNFVSGWSSNLTGRGDATERVFVYAPTGGDLSIGDGVARIKAIKGNSVVEDGRIKSLNVSALKTTGFNQWDEQWVIGYINHLTGELIIGGASTTSIASKNYIPVFPDTDYYFLPNTLPRLAFYDENKQFIKCITSASNMLQHTPENCHYMRFSTYSSYGTVYKNNICINISHTGYRNGEYEPYEEHTLGLSELSKYMPLRAIPGVCDEINANGVIKRIGVVKLKDLTWGSPNADLLSKSIFNAKISDMRPRGDSENETTYRKSILCSKYDIASNTSYDTMNDKSIFRQGSAYGIVIRDTAYTTVSDFVASLTDDDVVYYDLTEPTEVVFDNAINLNYLVSDFGTEEAIVAEDSAPFRADVIYQFNAQDRIRKNSEVIATIDSRYLAATPSGNPNHNLYISLGAVWSDAGWELNGVPLSNEEIDVSYLCSVPYLHRAKEGAWGSMLSYFNNRFNTNFCSIISNAYNSSSKVLNANSIGYEAHKLQVVRFQSSRSETSYRVFINNTAYMFGSNPGLREIQDYLDVSLCTSFTSAFGARATSLETIWLIGLKASINFAGTPSLKKECLLYMIQKAAPTSAITITVHAGVYAWASTDAEIQEALTAQPLVTLISA